MKVTERKSEIITIASQLFREKGYSAITMRDIAQAMDIKAASLYNHIKSKQEILVLIIIEIAEEFTTVMNEIVSSEVSSIEKIKNLFISISISHCEIPMHSLALTMIGCILKIKI